MTKESGFTLIELLTSITIVSILAANSVQIFSIMRDKAYDSSRDVLIHNAQAALEAGKSNFDNDRTTWVSIISSAAGLTTGLRGGLDGGGVVSANTIVPGLTVRSDMRIHISWDAWCNSGDMPWCTPSDPCCISESYLAYHCKGKKARNVVRWNNGETMEWEWDNWGC